MKARIYNDVAGVTTRANPCGAVTTWVVSANTFGFFGDIFSFLLYSWDRAVPPPHTHTHNRLTAFGPGQPR